MSNSSVPARIGVVGAGTMGAGIAQAAALGGFETWLHDPDGEALAAGERRAREGLERGAERGRWTAAEAEAAANRLRPGAALEDLASCELVIEAAPERLDLKRELFARLGDVCGPEVVLATNTSSLPVTALATAHPRPERVAGMHFFNPAPLMRLVEVVAGAQTAPEVVELARAVVERMGKVAILAADGPGFLVNRCGRPFGGEALRLLVEGVATVEQIDRVCRLGGGFRMGPFELMDLVGIDVGFEVSRSFYEQSFGEPRWRPSPLQARQVAAGRLGRKVGEGWYDHTAGPHRPEDPEPPAAGGGEGVILVEGESALAAELRAAADAAGYDARRGEELGSERPALLVDAAVPHPISDLGISLEDLDAPTLMLCAEGSLAQLDGGGSAVGFHALPPLSESGLVELTRGAGTPDSAAGAAEAFFGALGKRVEWVGDAPGLVLGRIVCQLINEAAFAVGEQIGSAEDCDQGARLGLNFPRGPLEWGDQIGLEHVLATLDGLARELGPERYRAAPLLRRMVSQGRFGRPSGAGFFGY